MKVDWDVDLEQLYLLLSYIGCHICLSYISDKKKKTVCTDAFGEISCTYVRKVTSTICLKKK